MNQSTVRIAMWSGPRNMSTTMMRSFGARPDTICVDEPFYAAYLKLTGVRHPMADAIFASQSADPEKVAAGLTDPVQSGCRVFYQKHMTHHMVPEIQLDWMAACRNVFLVRHPARVIASYARKMQTVTLDAIGFSQQLRLFQYATELEGRTPIVVNSSDILRDPRCMLQKLCEALGIDWSDHMLSWAPGPKPEDGAWGPHWYDAVWRSTGFASAPGDLPVIPDRLQHVYEPAMEIYERLAAQRLRGREPSLR